jgi:hypothetical protein
MFLTRASAVATRSNRPPQSAFSTCPAELHYRAGTVHHRISTSFPIPKTLDPPEHRRRPCIFSVIIILLLLLEHFIDRRGARPADTGAPHVTVSLGSYRTATDDLGLQSTVEHESMRTHVYCVTVFAYRYCHHHRYRRGR